MDEIEIWKPVVGYEELFLISSHGNMKSIRNGKEKLLKQNLHPNGIKTVATKIGGRKGKAVCFKIHRLVVDAFLEPPEKYILDDANKSFYGKVLVNHKDGIMTNNHVSNLEWCTYQENTIHAFANGLAKPKAQTTRKLSMEDVEYIRKVFVARHKEFGQRALARKFGINKSTIDSIINKETYVLPLDTK